MYSVNDYAVLEINLSEPKEMSVINVSLSGHLEPDFNEQYYVYYILAY